MAKSSSKEQYYLKINFDFEKPYPIVIFLNSISENIYMYTK